jgi:hypothetical protein
MRRPVNIETPEDAEWLSRLAMKIVAREELRKSEGAGVFSPSGLASCLRRVYLGRHWQSLDLKRVELPSVSAHGYFHKGNFVHLQWQFLFYKMDKALEDFTLLDCEVPVISKRGDHAGTIDVVVIWRGEVLPIDVKGLNVRSFNAIVRGDVPHDYRIQLTDYMMLWNSMMVKRNPDLPKMKRGLLLAESKGGPDPTHPLALHEVEITLKDNLPDVRARLEVLREHERKEEIPVIECITTKTIQFQGCPFAGYCKGEVKAEEKRRRDAESTDSAKLRVARPTGRNRTRRSKRK